MKQTTLIDVSKCTNINQLVKYTLTQAMTDGTSVQEHIKHLFTSQCKLDLARRVMYEYGYGIAYSRLRLLIRTQADNDAFRMYDDLSMDKVITRKQFAERVQESSADYKQCMKYVCEWLYSNYEEKLLTNVNHRVKSLVSVDTVLKLVHKYLEKLASRQTENAFSFCFDMVHEAQCQFEVLNKKYDDEYVDLEELASTYLTMYKYDVKQAVQAIRRRLCQTPTNTTVRKYNKKKVYLFDNGLVMYLYSIKTDGTKHKLVTIKSADTLTENANEWTVYKQHFLHDDICGYVSNYITSQTRQVKRTINSTTANSDGEEQSIFDYIIVDTDNGRADLAYINSDTEIAIKQYYKYLLEVKKVKRESASAIVQIIIHKAQGYSMEEIAQIMQVSSRTIYRIWKAYKADFRAYLLAD